MQRIPSTQALRSLESFARHGAVWKAADEMHLTRSAVSHQLRLLEKDVGFDLFRRVGTRIELTSRGRAFANDVRVALSQISGSASRNAGHGLSGELTISCTPGFAASWLSPKIKRFRAICPDLALSIITPRQIDDVSNPEVDLFIVFADERMKAVELELLKTVMFTPLISPALLNQLGGMHDFSDVHRAELLHLIDRKAWGDWLERANLPSEAERPGITFGDMNLAYNAAMTSQGIVLGDEFIFREAMENGRLVRPFDLAIQSPQSYYVATPPAKADIPGAVAFRQWILNELNGADG